MAYQNLFSIIDGLYKYFLASHVVFVIHYKYMGLLLVSDFERNLSFFHIICNIFIFLSSDSANTFEFTIFVVIILVFDIFIFLVYLNIFININIYFMPNQHEFYFLMYFTNQ